MNILFFLSPKQDLMYVYDDFTLRQTLEKWENNRYASIPVLNRRGEYVGTLTEGDILWGLKQQHGLDIEAAEDVPISSFAHKRDYKAVTVTTSMDQLIEAAMNQNFVPVVDDRGIFIGIVRRQAPGLLRGQLADSYRSYRKTGAHPVPAFVFSHCLGNFLGRPDFIAWCPEKRNWAVRLCARLGAMMVMWTALPEHDTQKLEAENDAVIFQWYAPKQQYK